MYKASTWKHSEMISPICDWLWVQQQKWQLQSRGELLREPGVAAARVRTEV